jgi:hypothetical protein
MKTMMAVVAFALATGNVKAAQDIRVSVDGRGNASSLISPLYVKYLRNLPGVVVVPTGEACDFVVIVSALGVTGGPGGVGHSLVGYAWAIDVEDANQRLIKGPDLNLCSKDLGCAEQSISEDIANFDSKIFRPFRQSSRSN